MASDHDRERRPGTDQRTLMMRFAGLAMELGSGIIGCTLLGYGFDYAFGTHRYGVITGAVLGCVGGMYHLIRQAFVIDKALRKTGPHYGPPSERPGDDDK